MKRAADRNDYTKVGMGALFLPVAVVFVWPLQLLGAVIAWVFNHD